MSHCSDTLHSLSLKYNVQLSELKRVNNILQESEFFALKRIKIPVKPSSLLTDMLPGTHSDKHRKGNGWYVENKDSPPAFSSNVSSRLSSGCSSPCSEQETPDDKLLLPESKDRKKVKKFLKEMDKDLARIKEKQSDLASSLELPGVGAALKVSKPVTAISSKSFPHTQPDSGRLKNFAYGTYFKTCQGSEKKRILFLMMAVTHNETSRLSWARH